MEGKSSVLEALWRAGVEGLQVRKMSKCPGGKVENKVEGRTS